MGRIFNSRISRDRLLLSAQHWLQSVTLFQHFKLQSLAFTPSVQLIGLAVLLAPVLEESLFRGCLFPLIANSAGNAVAMIVSAAFALFHGPPDFTHWVSFLLTGVVYSWLRAVSGATTAPAIAHSAYNLVLLAVLI